MLKPAADAGRLERFQAKWKPVRVKKTRQIKNLEPRFDSIETGLWTRDNGSASGFVGIGRGLRTAENPCGTRPNAGRER